MPRRNRTRMYSFMAAVAAVGLFMTACDGDDTTDDNGDASSVSFATPEDGATVTSPVTVQMNGTGVAIAPAAEAVEGAGHLHIMIDTECVAEGEAIPNDDTHRHFGDGSISGELELEPGEHTLCLQYGDNNHIASPYTDMITITVE